MKNCNCAPNNCAYPCCMSLRERLAFDRAWSVKIKRPTEVDTDVLYQLREDFGPSTADQYKRACRVPTWQGASLYEYGHAKPRFPLPATMRDSASNLAFRWSNWIDDAPQTKP